MARAESALAFLQGLNSSASTGIRAFGEGLMRAHGMRQEEAAALRAERGLKIEEAREGRAAELFPIQEQLAELGLEEGQITLEQKRSERERSKKQLASFDAASQELQAKLSTLLEVDPKAKLTKADVAEVAARHQVSPTDLIGYLGETLQQPPAFQTMGQGTAFGTVSPETGLFSEQGQIPFRPAAGGAGGGAGLSGQAALMNALVNLGEFARGGSKPVDPMQALMFALVSEKMNLSEHPGLEGVFKPQGPQGDPALLGMVQNELRNILQPTLQYDIDPSSGEGILFNPASGDTLFGGR